METQNSQSSNQTDEREMERKVDGAIPSQDSGNPAHPYLDVGDERHPLQEQASRVSLTPYKLRGILTGPSEAYIPPRNETLLTSRGKDSSELCQDQPEVDLKLEASSIVICTGKPMDCTINSCGTEGSWTNTGKDASELCQDQPEVDLKCEASSIVTCNRKPMDFTTNFSGTEDSWTKSNKDPSELCQDQSEVDLKLEASSVVTCNGKPMGLSINSYGTEDSRTNNDKNPSELCQDQPKVDLKCGASSIIECTGKTMDYTINCSGTEDFWTNSEDPSEPYVDLKFNASNIVECSRKLVDYAINSSGTEDSSSSTESLTESSTSESSDMSESENKVANTAVSDDDSGSQQPPRTKDEVLPQEVPLESLNDVKLPENAVLSEVGKLTSIVEGLAIVKAKMDCPALDSGSVLFSRDRRPLGRIFEVFGPVQDPFYSLRVSDKETEFVTKDDVLYFLPEIGEYTNFVFVEQVKRMKGSDASWQHDQEPPEEMIEYSDDEEEAKAKAALKLKKQKERLERQGLTLDDVSSAPAAPARQGKRNRVRKTSGSMSDSSSRREQTSNGFAVGPVMSGRGLPLQPNSSSGFFRPLRPFPPSAPSQYRMRSDPPPRIQGPPLTGIPRLEQRFQDQFSPPSFNQHHFQRPINAGTLPPYPPGVGHLPTRGPLHYFRSPNSQPSPRLMHDFSRVKMEDFPPPNNCLDHSNGPFPSWQQHFAGRPRFQEPAFHPRPPIGNNVHNNLQ